MTLKPLSDHVIIKQNEAEQKTKSGIILSTSAQEKPQLFEVLDVGPGGIVNGNEVIMTVKKGDMIITFNNNSSTKVKIDDEEYYIIRQNDILAVVE